MKEYSFLNKALITVEEIKEEFSSEAALFAALKRLTERGEIVKLKSGLYARVNPLTGDIFADRYEIGTALRKEGYIAYHSALEYYGLSTQVFNDVHIIAPSLYSPVTIEGLEYISFTNGYSEGVAETFNNAPVRVTEPERTVIDCIDRPVTSGGIEEVFYALCTIRYLDEEKLLKHLKGYGKKVLYKKTGYLFSLIKPDCLSDRFYQICQENMSQRTDDIRENSAEAYIYNNEWKIYAPKQICIEGREVW